MHQTKHTFQGNSVGFLWDGGTQSSPRIQSGWRKIHRFYFCKKKNPQKNVVYLYPVYVLRLTPLIKPSLSEITHKFNCNLISA